MKRFESQKAYLVCMVIMSVFVSILSGCGGGGGGAWKEPGAADTTRPLVSSTAPVNAATGVFTNARIINATFSENMAPLSITGSTFSVKETATALPVPGSVTYSGVTGVFTASADLVNNTNYTATITTGAKDLAGNALAADYVWTFTTGAGADLVPPAVTGTVNANGAIGVPLNTKVGATFSEPMNPTTINAATFTLMQGATNVPGTLAYTGVNLVFTPTSLLAANTTYTATVTTGAKDLAGNALAANYVWSWTTGAAADTTRPRVAATINANGATGVSTNTKVGATFSEAMDPLTITTANFSFMRGATNVPGTMAYSGVNMVFTPTGPLAANTLYTATITTAARDLAGNALAGNQAPLPAASNYVWSFTTAAAADIINPNVILTAPLDSAVNVPTSSTVNATFSEPMDPLTITNLTFSVAGVPGLVTYDGITRIATLTPSSPLAASTTYTATVTTAAKDLAGNPLLLNKVWNFTTAAVVIPPPVIPLGTVAPFGTFGGSAGMTNQGTLTIINGNIGTIATATSTVTGFHDTEGDIFTQTGSNIGGVNGTIYTCTTSTTGPNNTVVNAPYCAIATQARLDAVTAFNFLAGMPSSGVLAGNLAGLTINPGVYTNASSVKIEGGDLTLDALGDANAIFVFQIGSTLTVGGPGAAFPQSITLVGGAQAKNVYWQVGTFATINAGGGGTMVGTIIAQSGVSFSTAGNIALVTLNGRALSLISSVTMVNTVINVPAP